MRLWACNTRLWACHKIVSMRHKIVRMWTWDKRLWEWEKCEHEKWYCENEGKNVSIKHYIVSSNWIFYSNNFLSNAHSLVKYKMKHDKIFSIKRLNRKNEILYYIISWIVRAHFCIRSVILLISDATQDKIMSMRHKFVSVKHDLGFTILCLVDNVVSHA